MATTKIEFAHESLNFMAGCSRISPGCKNCWAVRMAHRHGGNPLLPQYHGLTTYKPHVGPEWTGEGRWFPGVAEKAIVRLALTKQPRRIVYNLMSDIAHKNAPEWALDRTLAFCAALPMHKHILITKRPEILHQRLAQLAPKGKLEGDRWDAARRPLYDACLKAAGMGGRAAPGQRTLLNKAEYIGYMGGFTQLPLKNVMLMATVEDQERLEQRAPHLLKLSLAGWHTGFIVEPMLEGLDFSVLRHGNDPDQPVFGTQWGPEWVVCGMKQGPGKRYTPAWKAGKLADECAAAQVPFFFKKDSDGCNLEWMPRQFPAWMEV